MFRALSDFGQGGNPGECWAVLGISGVPDL